MIYTNGHINGNHNPIDDLSPHNLEAESAALGSVLVDPDALLNLGFLQPADFFIERNGWIYEALRALYDKQIPPDLVTLCDALEQQGRLEEVGGLAYLAKLMDATPTAIHAEYYAQIVAREAIKRRLIDTAARITQLAYASDDPETLLAEAESLLLEVSDSRTQDSTFFMGELASMVYDHIERVRQAGTGITGIPTGLTDLDKLLGGLQRSDMIVLAGRPGMGKTSLAVQIAKTSAKKQGARSLIFSLEMGKEQLAQRVIASETGIDVSRLRRGEIREQEWPAFFQAQEALSKYPVAVDDAPILTPALLRSKAIRHQARHGLDLIIVDYLQLMRGDGKQTGNRTQEVDALSRACKTVARELNIPVLVLSSLSRNCEGRTDKRPMLSDLRESGSIESDADIVAFIYRDEVYNAETTTPNVAEIIIAKHRSGPTGTVSAYFRKHLTEFVDLSIRTIDFKQVD